MIPSCGPAPTGSEGERALYFLLKEQLSGDFTVIHSLPWLSSAVRQMSDGQAVKGEIDFLILHPDLGALVLEVKGGAHKIHNLAFVHIKTGTTTRAVEQLHRNVHGLARWLGVNPSLRIRLGYALVFPHSNFEGKITSTALVDTTSGTPQNICLDQSSVSNIGSQVREIMAYWRRALSNPPLGQERMAVLIKTLCPEFDGTPSWASRVLWDSQLWLRLTDEQAKVVNESIAGNRLVVTGWPGTGKTLILIECARRLLQQGKRILVLTFNSLLAEHLRAQIDGDDLVRVGTWHWFCRTAAGGSQQNREFTKEWLESGCLAEIDSAVSRGEVQPVDAILIDEAQTFRRQWIDWVCNWHSGRQLLTFCDETQVFSFEENRVNLADLCLSIGVESPFSLTIPLRSPKAVLERLKQVFKTAYLLYSPRENELDTLEELVVTEVDRVLFEVLDKLKGAGLGRSDIVVLRKFTGGMPNGSDFSLARFETVSKFRGLEVPVVIVFKAEQMDDIELFCAYSRSTTLCIAIYDAEVIGVRGPECKFQEILLDNPGNVAEAKRAKLCAQSGEIVRNHFSPKWLDIRTANIAWLPNWGAWILEEKDELSNFWLDYLIYYHQQPVISWEGESIRMVFLSSPVDNMTNGSASHVSYHLIVCDHCGFSAPHQVIRETGEWECLICSGKINVAVDQPNDEAVNDIKRLDELAFVPNPKTIAQDQKKSIPLPLAAGAALSYAIQHHTKETVSLNRDSGRRITYRAALAFTDSIISLSPKGRPINVAKMADDLYGRYSIPSELTPKMWKVEMSMAFNVAYRRGYLTKLGKGVYSPVA
jgi:hypothetical protein